jgi:polyphosphate kinase
MDDRSDLKFKSFTPSIPNKLKGSVDLFQTIAKKDILVYHPYESFLPVVDFLKQAAADPNVLAIKQTLYRTGPDSAVVDALVEAASKGKEVTVVIEIRARFDEADNIALANRLQEVGAQVAYGVVGIKTHVKMIIVVRREKKGLQHYVHLSTGNYHPGTTRVYTDYGLFTRDKAIGEDVHKVFIQLTSLGKVSKLQKCYQSPFTLHSAILSMIERETAFAQAGKEARIIAKMNALTEKPVIQALYRASMAGVKIQLIIRGVCRLKPGVAGISDNISVISIVGRFLEHNRVCYFHNNGAAEIFCSSADWMDRNFHQRVELLYPIENKSLKELVIRHLDYQLKDNQLSWALEADGQYTHIAPNEDEPVFCSQDQLLADYGG